MAQTHQKIATALLVALTFGTTIKTGFCGVSPGQAAAASATGTRGKTVTEERSGKAPSGASRAPAPPPQLMHSDPKSEHGETLPAGHLDRGNHAHVGSPLKQKTPAIVPPKSPAAQMPSMPSLSKTFNTVKMESMSTKPQIAHNQALQSSPVKSALPGQEGLRGRVPASTVIGGLSLPPKNNAVLNGTGMRHKP